MALLEQAGDGRLRTGILIAALVVFVLYAANFLFFFVDDEGIALVYAERMLDGHPFTYNSFEGRVEGYSNFLDVLIRVVLIACVKIVQAPQLTVFLLGKGLSFAAGIGVIALTFASLRRVGGVTDAGLAAGMAVVATAGPLAVWSCSSLDAVPFTFLVMLIVFALVAGQEAAVEGPFDRLAVVAVCLASLERLDGPIYAFTVLAAWWTTAAPARRAQLLRRVIVPALVLVAGYHAWRIWYFGDVVNMPVYAKILHKVLPQPNSVIKAAEVPYWRGFVDLYGLAPVAVLAAAAGAAAFRSRPMRPVLLAAIGLTAYVATVGDWMFGFRFFVPILPLFSMIVAGTLSATLGSRTALAWIAAGVVTVWAGDRAIAFERSYEAVERKPSWLRHPTIAPSDFFGSYYDLLRAAEAHIPRGARTAYNQAGFLPFMLDLDNVDNLGICSRFYAKLPVRDVFFTEVGRYSPLSALPAIEAAQAYLLYHDVQFVIERNDLLRSANHGAIPDELMGGYYVRVQSLDADTIYRRSARDGSAYRRNPDLFTENVAHVSRIRTAAIDGGPVPFAEIPARLPLLRYGTSRVGFTGASRIDVHFAAEDVYVSELSVAVVHASHEAAIDFEVQSIDGQTLFASRVSLAKQAETPIHVRIPGRVFASRLRLTVSAAPQRTNVWITDLRVLGQSSELAAYVRRVLAF